MIFLSTFLSVATSNADVASSRSRIGDFLSSALAIDRRCACPSENPPPRSFTILLIPSGSFSMKSHAHASFNASMISSSVASGFTFRKFSAIVPENIVFPCGTYENSLLVDGDISTVLLWSSPAQIHALPSCGLSSDKISRSIVVFPSPDGPTNATISCG